MKKLVLMSALIFGGLAANTANAQIGIHLNLHIGTPAVYVSASVPVSEPVYDDDYYYLPDVEAYYSVPEHCYYYYDGYSWISAAYLPGRYHDFDWRSARRYEIHSNRPYLHHDVYRGKFGGFTNRDEFYAGAFPGRSRVEHGAYDSRNHFDRGNNNHDWNNPSRGGFDRNDRNSGYNQSQPNSNQGGYNDNHNRGNNSGYNGQGGYTQPDNNRGQGSYNHNDNQSTSPSNGSRDGGNTGGQQHFTQNNVGVVNPGRNMVMNRPSRF